MFKVNEYFDGKVKSIGFETKDGPATIGVLAKGEYEFGTTSQELMTVINGKMLVKRPCSEEWREFVAGETFMVAPNVKFGVRVEEDTPYLCLYR